MSKKKKQTMTIVILCVLLVAAGIGYYGAGVHQKKKAAKEAAQEDKEITLYSLKADDLVSVHVDVRQSGHDLYQRKRRMERC